MGFKCALQSSARALSVARMVLVCVLCVLTGVTIAHTVSSCKALVQIGNNLWLVNADGSVIKQVTNDSQFRTAAALNPAGNLIAFSGKDSPMDVTLLDANGRLIGDVDLKAIDAITQLDWVSPSLLVAQEHLNPNASRFHWIRFGPGNTASVLHTAPAEGSACAASPDGKDMACTLGAAALELNGRTVLVATDAIASATTVQAMDVAIGTGVTTSTSPAFRIDVIEIEGATVHLKITTSDGLWTEQYVPAGGSMDVRFGDGADRTPQYVVLPQVSTNSGVVHLSVLKSDTGAYSFEGGIAWSPNGKRLALVEANPAGQRFWVLLNRHMGHAAISGHGAVDAREVLPIDGPVRSIAFTSGTHLRIEGATQIFDKDIPAEGKAPSGGRYLVSPAMPQQLTVKLGAGTSIGEVKGWSCR